MTELGIFCCHKGTSREKNKENYKREKKCLCEKQRERERERELVRGSKRERKRTIRYIAKKGY